MTKNENNMIHLLIFSKKKKIPHKTTGMAEKARGNGTTMIYPSIMLIAYMLSVILHTRLQNVIKS